MTRVSAYGYVSGDTSSYTSQEKNVETNGRLIIKWIIYREGYPKWLGDVNNKTQGIYSICLICVGKIGMKRWVMDLDLAHCLYVCLRRAGEMVFSQKLMNLLLP